MNDQHSFPDMPPSNPTLREKIETWALCRLTQPGRSSAFREKIIEQAGIGAGAKVLDIATAVGGMAFAAKEAGANVTAIDASPERIEIAKSDPRANGIDFRVIDAAKTPFADDEFDVALIVLGLHEMKIDGAKAVLKEARRIARRLVVVEFGLDDWPLFWSFARYPLALFEPAGFLKFTRHNLHDLIENAGWRIAKTEKGFPFTTYVCE